MDDKAKRLSEETGINPETIEGVLANMGLSIEDIDFSMFDAPGTPIEGEYIDGLAIGTDAGIVYIPPDSE